MMNRRDRRFFHPSARRTVSSSDTNDDEPTSSYHGVSYFPDHMKKFKTELKLSGQKIIDGGDHWTAEDAARAYDDLVRLYLGSTQAHGRALNFPHSHGDEQADTAMTRSERSGSGSAMEDATPAWIRPGQTKKDGALETSFTIRKGQYLNVDEILVVLNALKGQDIVVVDLKGKSCVGEHMIFVTGRSLAHMRKMADTIVDGLRDRELRDEFDYGVEGRDCDDWMLVDGNTVIVHFLRHETRTQLKLEEHWAGMKNNRHEVYGDYSADEYVTKFGPVHLDQDDDEAEEKDWH